MSPEKGLANLLLGEGTLDEVLQETGVDGLSFLPCGPIPPNPAELLHTERFKKILDQLGEKFDRIILDTPPLTAVADAKVLSTRADGVIVIAKAHTTTRDMLGSATDGLLEVNARILGVVLNQVDVEKREYGGYYYRYYRNYGAYYGDDAKDAEKPAPASAT